MLLANDIGENIGLSWYLVGCMFNDFVPFFRHVLVCIQLACCLFVSLLMWNLFDVLDWGAESKERVIVGT